MSDRPLLPNRPFNFRNPFPRPIKEATLPADIRFASLPDNLRRVAPELDKTTGYRLLLAASYSNPDFKLKTKDCLKKHINGDESIFFLQIHDFLKGLHWTVAESTDDGSLITYRIKVSGKEGLFKGTMWHFLPKTISTMPSTSLTRNCQFKSYPYLIEIHKEELLACFDREKCKPILNLSNVIDVIPNQKIDLVIKNFRPGLSLQLLPSEKTIPIPQPTLSFTIPGGETNQSSSTQPQSLVLNLLLHRPGAEAEKITYRLKQQQEQQQQQHQQLIKPKIVPKYSPSSMYPYVAQKIDDIDQFNKDINKSFKFSINPQQTTPLRTIVKQHQSIISSNTFNINEKKTLHSNSRKSSSFIYTPTKTIKKQTIERINNNNNNNHHHEKINFQLTDIMRDRLCGTVSIKVLIRVKRHGTWVVSNFEPSKIGKMRKIDVNFNNLTKKAYILVETSNSRAVQVSLSEKKLSDNLNFVSKVIDPFCPSTPIEQKKSITFTYYLLPQKDRGSATVSLYVYLLDNNENEGNYLLSDIKNNKKNILLHSWDLNVAGHKFESSKSNATLNNSNIKQKVIPLIFPPLGVKVQIPTYYRDISYLLHQQQQQQQLQHDNTSEINSSGSHHSSICSLACPPSEVLEDDSADDDDVAMEDKNQLEKNEAEKRHYGDDDTSPDEGPLISKDDLYVSDSTDFEVNSDTDNGGEDSFSVTTTTQKPKNYKQVVEYSDTDTDLSEHET